MRGQLTSRPTDAIIAVAELCQSSLIATAIRFGELTDSAAVKLAGRAVQGGLALTAFTVIEIATGILQKFSLGKASKVPEVTENSRRPSEHLTCDHVPRCRMRADWFAIGMGPAELPAGLHLRQSRRGAGCGARHSRMSGSARLAGIHIAVWVPRFWDRRGQRGRDSKTGPDERKGTIPPSPISVSKLFGRRRIASQGPAALAAAT